MSSLTLPTRYALANAVAESAQTTETKPAKPQGEAKPESKPEAASDHCLPPVAGAYPCAGGPIPADARPLMAQDVPGHEIVWFETPSTNLACSVESDLATCVVWSWDGQVLAQHSYSANDVGGLMLEQNGSAVVYPVSEARLVLTPRAPTRCPTG